MRGIRGEQDLKLLATLMIGKNSCIRNCWEGSATTAWTLSEWKAVTHRASNTAYSEVGAGLFMPKSGSDIPT